MDEEAGFVEPRIVALAERLREVGPLQTPDKSSSIADVGRSQSVWLRGPDGREFVETVALHPRETLVQATDGSAYAVVGDFDGDENYRIRIRAATQSGIRLVHRESPISPRVRPFGAGLLWIRRDATRRPHRALWWGRTLNHPAILLDEPDRTHRLDLRSMGDNTAIVASQSPMSTSHWMLLSRDGAIPASRPLTEDTGDAVLWRGGVVVLDRRQRRVRAGGADPFEAVAPEEFVAEHLQPSGDALFVVGRHRGRRAAWVPSQGSTGLWTAPPAGTMLPSFDPVDKRPAFLVSSPVHKPQVVRPDVGGEVRAASTGRADIHRLTAASSDGTPIPITLFVPPGPEAHPLVAHVYGAYGISLEGPFDPFTDDLLARGVAVAYCHVRGGGENGPEWHRQATGVHRHRTIDDLLACLALLRGLPTIAAHRIVLSAASAGGLTAAAACLRKPTWLRGLHLVHPFVDPVQALMNPDANLTTTDWAEYGDPRDDSHLKDLLERLSPLATVRGLPPGSCPLPRAWIRAAHHDTRVDPGAVEQFSRLYRGASTSTETSHVTYRFTDGGHLGGQSADPAHEENLLAHAWVLDRVEARTFRAT